MVKIQGRLSAVTYRHDPQQPQFTFVFGRSYPDGQVHALRRLETGWTWIPVGAPTGTKVSDQVSAIAYPDGPVHRVRLFATAANGHLYRAHPTGSSWSWVDMGQPAGVGLAAGPPSAVTYEDSDAGRQIYVFVRGQNGHLYANRHDGFEWSWDALGQVPGENPDEDSKPIVGPPAAVAFQDGGNEAGVYAFVRCADNTLGLYRYLGGQGGWAEVQPGTPAAGPLADPPTDVDQDGHLSALTYKEGANAQRVYCFAVIDGGQDGRSLHAYFGTPQSDETPMHWSSQLDGTVSVPCLGDSVTYKDGIDKQKLFVHFSNYQQGDVTFSSAHRMWWDGYKWALSGQGSVVPTAPPAAVTFKDVSGNRAVEAFVPTQAGVQWGHQTCAGFIWDNLGTP
jgi:hypothetical protein